MEPQAFVAKILQLQKQDGVAYVGTARKDWVTGDWHDWVNKWPAATLPDEPDLYFCPVLFAKRSRRQEHALPGRVLYADLDAVDPRTLEEAYGVRPTLAWETSPGRYQCLWILDKHLPPDKFEELNQKMTYLVGADKGGWSRTKVLRIPGSISTKYGRSRGKRFTVRLVGGRGPRYTAAQIRRLTSDVKVGPVLGIADVFGDLGVLPNRRDVLAEWRKRLPERAKRLLAAKHVPLGSDRSAKLWELYNVLLQAGMAPAQVLVVVQPTVWNKYHGQNREVVQLQREIAKAAQKHAQPEELERMRRPRRSGKRIGATGIKLEKRKRQRPDKLPFLTYDEFMAKAFPSPEWLVEGFWSKGAYGFCAGEYKSFKTMTLLNMVVSVASGTPFLGKFPVIHPGRVLYVHEEGREGSVQDRLYRIAGQRGVHPNTNGKTKSTEVELRGPDVHISSFPGLNFRDPESQRWLVTYFKEERPVLAILESWYLMASEISETNQHEVGPILKWIGDTARSFGVSLIISHHYNKSHVEAGVHRRALDRVSGSTVFNRWWESAILLERSKEEDEYAASIEAHHRDQKGVTKQTMRIEMDVEDEDSYEVTLVESDIETTAQKEQQVVKVAESLIGRRMRRYALARSVYDQLQPLGWTAIQVDRVLLKAGYVKRKVRLKRDGPQISVFQPPE